MDVKAQIEEIVKNDPLGRNEGWLEAEEVLDFCIGNSWIELNFPGIVFDCLGDYGEYEYLA